MSITATTEQQHQLLDLQSLDNQLSRLRTQLSEIRQDEQLAGLRREGASAVERAKAQETQVAQRQTVVDEAAKVVQETTTRRNRMQSQMDADEVSSRDVPGVTKEIAELTIRVGKLEEEQLQAEQALEEAQRSLEQAQTAIVNAEQAVNARITTLNEQGQQLSKQGKELTAERSALIEDLPADLVAEYEQIRDQNHGTGVMQLQPDGLSGAGVPIAPAELAEIQKQPANELTYCPDTGAILVRN